MADVMSQVPEIVDRLPIAGNWRSTGLDASDEKDESHPDVVWLVEGCQHSRLLLTRWGLLSWFRWKLQIRREGLNT